MASSSQSPSLAQTDPNAGGQVNSMSSVASHGPTYASGLLWGPMTLHPHFDYRLLYGDGIQAMPGHPSTTAINSFAPGLLTELGTHWSLDYTPTWNYYSNKLFRDTVDHAARLDGETTYEEWILGFSQTFGITTQPLIETGEQTREEDYNTHFNADYQFASQLMLETDLNQNVRLASGFSDSRDWSLREMLHLQLSPRFTTAVGVEYGYTEVSNAADMSYVQVLGKVVWHPVDQLNFQLEGGLENRTIRQKGVSDLRNPTLSASIQYLPVKTTTLSLTADHSTSVSYFADQVIENTHIVVGLEQRLLGIFNLSTNVGYQEASYRATDLNTAAGRKDESWSFGARLQTILLHRVTVAATYQSSHNTSNAVGFGFSSNQIGLEVGYKY